MFLRFKQIKVMGSDVSLVGFDLSDHTVVAVCRQGKRKACVTLNSVEFPELTPIEQRYLIA